MNNLLENMVDRYHPTNNVERENAIKEIIQEIVLSAFGKTDFFTKVAFYGGTCLRIFYGLNMFSEDLDFALLEKNTDFRLDDYFPFLKKEFESYGLDIDIKYKKKTKDTEIQSSFSKGNTLLLMMSFFPKNEDVKRIVSNQKIKIKFEIDIDNPSGGISEYRHRMLPSPYEAQIFDESTLFAGKIHALLCQGYKPYQR